MANRILVLVFLSVITLNIFSQTGDIVQKGQEVPQFTFTTANGEPISVSDYKGKVIFINFFATWCGPCRQEMPLLQEKVWSKYKANKDFKFLSFGRGHSQEEITKFVKSNNFYYPMFPDKDKTIYNMFATSYIPRNYIVDKNGKIVYLSVGFTNEDFNNMLESLEKLLN
jgi:peroxiredoxin